MKKRLFAMLLVVVMVFGILPVAAAGENPEIQKVNMTLGSILGINFKVNANGSDMSGYKVRVTIVSDGSTQVIDQYKMDGDLYVYTAKLPAHRLPETLKIELMNGDTVVQTEENWTVNSYLDDLVKINPEHTQLQALAAALKDYGAYAAYYAAPTGTAPSSAAVEAVQQSDLTAYCFTIKTANAALRAVAALYIDDACDLRVKFDSAAWEGNSLLINDEADVVTEEDGKIVYNRGDLLPQDWSELYNIKAVNADGTVVYEINYGVLSYAYIALGREKEAQTGLNGLLKAMYLYQQAAVAYINGSDEIIENGPIDEDDGPSIDFGGF